MSPTEEVCDSKLLRRLLRRFKKHMTDMPGRTIRFRLSYHQVPAFFCWMADLRALSLLQLDGGEAASLFGLPNLRRELLQKASGRVLEVSTETLPPCPSFAGAAPVAVTGGQTVGFAGRSWDRAESAPLQPLKGKTHTLLSASLFSSLAIFIIC